jgi:hypothetical protein
VDHLSKRYKKSKSSRNEMCEKNSRILRDRLKKTNIEIAKELI